MYLTKKRKGTTRAKTQKQNHPHNAFTPQILSSIRPHASANPSQRFPMVTNGNSQGAFALTLHEVRSVTICHDLSRCVTMWRRSDARTQHDLTRGRKSSHLSSAQPKVMIMMFVDCQYEEAGIIAV